MDESETQVVRINVPMRKSVDVTIDLRRDRLMHLFTVDNMDGLAAIDSPDNSVTNGNSIPCNGQLEKSSTRPDKPSTIILLKIVPPEVNKSEGIRSRESSCGVKDDRSSESISNINCLRVRSSLCEMHKEKATTRHRCDEQANILKEFEITMQLEKLRTETKKVSRRKYAHRMGKMGGHVLQHSPKSEASSDQTNIKSIFNDDVSQQIFPALNHNYLKNIENALPPQNNILETPEESINQMLECTNVSPSPKRKNISTCGPLSKKLKLSGKESNSVALNDRQRKWIVFGCHSTKTYQDGRKKSVNLEDQSPEKNEIPLLIDRDLDEDLSQIGLELLQVWKLNDNEVEELKKQLKEEFEHKQKEHIMPLIMNMSPDQIESTYLGVRDVMKMYDITEQDSDEESRRSSENVEEEGKLTELKSLDALYKEEFSKKYYRDLFNVVDGGTFWRNNEDKTQDKQTVYKKNRPKRSSVDYTPSAYAFIGYMEGRRPRWKHKDEKSLRKVSNKHFSSSSSSSFDDDDDQSSNSCDEISCSPNNNSLLDDISIPDEIQSIDSSNYIKESRHASKVEYATKARNTSPRQSYDRKIETSGLPLPDHLTSNGHQVICKSLSRSVDHANHLNVESGDDLNGPDETVNCESCDKTSTSINVLADHIHQKPLNDNGCNSDPSKSF